MVIQAKSYNFIRPKALFMAINKLIDYIIKYFFITFIVILSI